MHPFPCSRPSRSTICRRARRAERRVRLAHAAAAHVGAGAGRRSAARAGRSDAGLRRRIAEGAAERAVVTVAGALIVARAWRTIVVGAADLTCAAAAVDVAIGGADAIALHARARSADEARAVRAGRGAIVRRGARRTRVAVADLAASARGHGAVRGATVPGDAAEASTGGHTKVARPVGGLALRVARGVVAPARLANARDVENAVHCRISERAHRSGHARRRIARARVDRGIGSAVGHRNIGGQSIGRRTVAHRNVVRLGSCVGRCPARAGRISAARTAAARRAAVRASTRTAGARRAARRSGPRAATGRGSTAAPSPACVARARSPLASGARRRPTRTTGRAARRRRDRVISSASRQVCARDGPQREGDAETPPMAHRVLPLGEARLRRANGGVSPHFGRLDENLRRKIGCRGRSRCAAQRAPTTRSPMHSPHTPEMQCM